MMMNKEIKAESTARLAALGRKAISDLEPGDAFSHSFLGDLEFLGWVSPYFSGITRGAFVRETFSGSPTRCVSLNVAGSVKMMEN